MGILYDIVEDDFSGMMNPPGENTDHKPYTEFHNGNMWLCCPYCGKRQFQVSRKTKIENMTWKCKGSNCKKEFDVRL